MKQHSLIGLVLIVAFIGGIWAAVTIAPPDVKPQGPATTYFQTYPAPRGLPSFRLTEAGGEPVTNATLRDQWTVIFLGYTYCPDVCPTTMAGLNRIYPQLQQIPTEYPIKIMFLSVDPKRDTPARLRSYKQYFNDDFIAATGDHGQLFGLVRSFGLVYAMSESTDQPDYLVDHSASIVVVSPKAEVVGRFKPDAIPGALTVVDPAHIIADMPAIVAAH